VSVTRLTALCPGQPGWAGTRKVKPIWISLKHEIVSSSGISWAICKFAPCTKKITMPVPHHSVYYRPDAFPAAQPTVSKHWRHLLCLLHGVNWWIVPSVLWRCWLGGRKGIQPVKNWVVGCWHGYLSGARCRLAYGPAVATATYCLLLQ